MLKVSTRKKSDRSVRRAARLRLGAAVFLRFMRDVAKWTTTVESRLSKLYIKAGVDNVIELYAIPRSMKYDFELRRLLSEFVLVQDASQRPARGMLVPDGTEEELRAFFDPSECILIAMG